MAYCYSLIASLILGGCPPPPKPGPVVETRIQAIREVSLAELKSVQLSNRDCSRIDYWTNYAEDQLRFRGLLNATPENLSDYDKEFNATARAIVWSLRIGCNNPNRYR